VEVLENRLAPAVFNPSPSAADGGGGSLREALIAANGNAEDDTITLQAGTYVLSVGGIAAGQENQAARGDLDVTEPNHSITFAGAGAGVTVIDGGAIDRIFQVLPNVTATFTNLTLRNGQANDCAAADLPP
jgi:hypothetical protein